MNRWILLACRVSFLCVFLGLDIAIVSKGFPSFDFAALESHLIDKEMMTATEQTKGMIDGMVAGHFPVIYPARRNITAHPRTLAEIRRIAWNILPNGTATRYHGYGEDAIPPFQGGTTVSGKWPDSIRQLFMIQILKNAHTAMGIAFDDLRQRLGIPLDKTPWIPRDKIPRTLEMELVPRWNETLLFATLRDPIDRFFSATCQDLLSQRVCLKESAGDTLNCMVERIAMGKFPFHAISQSIQLAGVMKTQPDLPVTVYPFNQTSQLIREMGVERPSAFARNRDYNVGKASTVVAEYCKLKPVNLTAAQASILCGFYRDDVELLRSVDFSVPLCE